MMPDDARNAIGLQVFGPRGSEDLVLKAASFLGSA
jgi:Asp-tRNA(Asn)/Glu-tRNA(Gln) amidotransferase A subunit family amidase